jgi:chorismate synthase
MLWGQEEVLGMPTAGNIVVTDITDNSYTIAAEPGHPDYPGTVKFEFTSADGTAYLNVTAESAAPVPTGNLGAYKFIIEHGVWSPYALSVCNVLSDAGKATC